MTVAGHMVIKMLDRLFGERPIIDEEKLATEQQKLKEEYEKRLHQNKLILIDLENWIEKTEFAYIDYRDGELEDAKHRNSDLPHFENTKKVLENRNAYTLWTKGIENSNCLHTKGKNAIKTFHTKLDRELESIPLKKSLKWGLLQEHSYVLFGVRQSIFDGIKNIKNLNLQINNGFLLDGTRTLAEGETETLTRLKKIIENLVENEIMRKNIRIYNEVKEKIDYREPFKEFQKRLNEIIQEYRFSKIRS